MPTEDIVFVFAVSTCPSLPLSRSCNTAVTAVVDVFVGIDLGKQTITRIPIPNEIPVEALMFHPGQFT